MEAQSINTCARAVLAFYSNAGVGVLLDDAPHDRTAQAKQNHNKKPIANSANNEISSAPQSTENAAESAKTLKDLEEIIKKFDGLAIAKTATNTVFARGNENANIMVITPPPAAQEDRSAIPASGQGGQLLDKILGAIELDSEKDTYIAPAINWRPPGGRTPTQHEINICTPFLKKHIELTNPKIIILCGKLAAQMLLGKSEPLSKLRGKWYDYNDACVRIMHNPDSLLNARSQKKFAWDDILALLAKLEELGYK